MGFYGGYGDYGVDYGGPYGDNGGGYSPSAGTGTVYVTADNNPLPPSGFTLDPSAKAQAIQSDPYIQQLEQNSINASMQGSPHEEGFETFTDGQGNTITVIGTPVSDNMLSYDASNVPTDYSLQVQFHTHPDDDEIDGRPDDGDASGLAKTNGSFGDHSGIGIVYGLSQSGSGHVDQFYGPGSGSKDGH